MMKRLFLTIFSTMIALGLSAQISIIGSATPAKNWETDFNMNQDTGNPDLWSLRIQLSGDFFKFRQDGSWDNNWGGTAFPSGTAIPNGPNIEVPPSGGDYFVTFNTSTLAYNFELVNTSSSGITHQAVIRDAANQLVTNQNIGVRVSIIQYATTGPVVYAETHLPTSNVNGLITYVIGQGATESGAFDVIDWSDGPYFLKTEADPDGGSSYTISGISQFLSVPYALHAGSTSDKQWDQSGNNIYNTNSGNVGVGTSSPSQKLDIDGQVRIRGGSAGEGKFLSSDADGTASWQPISSATYCFDIDGNTYPTTIIGNQIWMAENLRVTKYRNGNTIPNPTDIYAWYALTSGAYCWFDNDQSENAKFGALYNWYAINDTRGLCPEGWRVPTDVEWTALTNMLGGESVAGGKLKSLSNLWINPNIDATNSTGFSALPGGFLNTYGEFSGFGNIGHQGYWWSSTEYSSELAWYRFMIHDFSVMYKHEIYKTFGFSVRCLRDID